MLNTDMMRAWAMLPRKMRPGDLTFIQAVNLRNEMQKKEETLTQYYTDGLVTEVEWAQGCFYITLKISLLYHRMKELAEQREREMNIENFEFEGLQVAMTTLDDGI